MGVMTFVGTGFRKVFGSRNDRLLKAYGRIVTRINALESDLRGDYDARIAAAVAKLPADLPEEERPAAIQKLRVEHSQDLRDRTAKLKERFAAGESDQSILPRPSPCTARHRAEPRITGISIAS